MALRDNLLAVLATVSFFCCTSTKNATEKSNDLLPEKLLPYGRTRLNADKGLELIGSAVHVGFSFEGKECKLYTAISGQDHNYIQYELDGVYQQRLRLSSANNNPVTIPAATEGKHTVWIYKATEAHTGPVFIQKITGKNIQPLKSSTAPLIEFIGNSITCGAAADDAEVPCGTGVYHDQHNAYMAYGPRVARVLKANFIVSAVSGIGIYRNWNSNGPAMPQVYEKTDFQDAGNDRWDFTLYKPTIVSIALGTNDFSKGDGKKARLPFDSAAFVNSYVAFVRRVKTYYPTTQIVLLSSAMINGDSRLLLQNCLTAVKASVDSFYTTGKPVALYFFKPMRARGCGGHPNVGDHRILAEELTPFFQKLLQ